MPTTRYAGWLPPIDFCGATGWFPLKTTSLPAIMDGLAAGVSAPANSVSEPRRLSCNAALSTDPALLMYTTAQVSLAGGFCTPESCSIESLSRWWCEHGRAVWRKTDWLAVPDPVQSRGMLARYSQLDDYFRTLPPARWLGEADLWFATAGVGNPIADGMSLLWPSVDAAATVTSPSPDAHLSIANWLRESDQQHIRSGTFDKVLQSRKRELAHTLAYGLSHEINNPLANISTRAQAMMLQGSLPRECTDSLQRIVDQTSRAHAMIADLMFYAKPPAIQRHEFDLVARMELVIASFAETSSRLGIEIGLVSSHEPLLVNADAEMIGELVAVLVKNSIEAIGCDGRITAEVSRTDEQVRVVIADSGPGMTAAQAAMAMDPYYSGREAGRGLGLGLCRADRIAGLHDGDLRLTPALAGCVATLRLPIS